MKSILTLVIKKISMAENVTKILTERSRKMLDAPLTLKDLKKALKKMKKGKTPGIDGLTAEFFMFFQDLLLPILLEVATFAKSIEKMSPTQRKAVIALLHKAGLKYLLTNFRPISLLCVDLKIITKALAMRLQLVLTELVDEAQTAGVPGRSISIIFG